MKALLRPLFVGVLSMAIAATSVVGSSSVALAATPPLVTTWWLDLPVYEGASVFLNGTFTGGVGHGPYTVDVDWLGDGTGTFETYSFETLDLTAYPQIRVQKAQPYANDQAAPITVAAYLSDPLKTNRANLPSFTILNSAPSFESFGLSATNPETGQAVTATGVFKDAGSTDTHTVTLDWGDGTLPTVTSLGAALSFTTDGHAYTTADVFTVTATIADDAGATAVASSTVTVSAPNQAPTIEPFSVTAGPEGGSSTLSLTFADADALDTHTVSVDWGDGETTNSAVLAAGETTFGAPHVYADTGTYSVALTLKDNATPAHAVTMTKSVSPANVGPVVGSLTLSPSSVVDHELLTVSGTFTDPGTADTFTLTVDWGDGTAPSEQSLGTARSFSATHSYEATGPVTITASVKDRDGATSNSSSVSLDVLSSNRAPADLAFGATVTGASVVVNGTFNDADAADTDTVVVTWGDGAWERQTLVAGATTFTASHVYATSNTYTVTATVTDPSGASTSATRPVVVTVPATSASDVLDEMSSLVWSFDLDRNTERWLLKKLDDMQGSLAYGNGQICSSTGLLNHVLSFAQRTLRHEQYAALSALAPQLQAAAGCASNGSQLPKVLKAAAVTTTAMPVLKDPATSQKNDTTAKATKSDSKATQGRSVH